MMNNIWIKELNSSLGQKKKSQPKLKLEIQKIPKLLTQKNKPLNKIMLKEWTLNKKDRDLKKRHKKCLLKSSD